MSIIAIAAVDANWGIGYKGELLERIPADMKFFKETTENHTVIMGRKTWESLPTKPLPNRFNIIVTNCNSGECITESMASMSMDNVIDRINQLSENEDFYIIGGASIYEQLLPYCDKAYITRIYIPHDNVDAYFPNLNKMPEEWELIEESPFSVHNGFYYSFTTYQRIN